MKKEPRIGGCTLPPVVQFRNCGNVGKYGGGCRFAQVRQQGGGWSPRSYVGCGHPDINERVYSDRVCAPGDSFSCNSEFPLFCPALHGVTP